MAGLEERSRILRAAEKAKHMTIKYTLVFLAVGVAMIIGGYIGLNNYPKTITVALGLALGAASPLLAFYITYVRVIKPLMKGRAEG